MIVYPKQIVFCPKTGKEQNGNNCLSCEFYNNHRLEDAGLPLIDCKFEPRS